MLIMNKNSNSNNSSNTMARFLSIRTPFSRRKNNNSHGHGGGKDKALDRSVSNSTIGSIQKSQHTTTTTQDRKISIDQTVLTRDEDCSNSASAGGRCVGGLGGGGGASSFDVDPSQQQNQPQPTCYNSYEPTSYSYSSPDNAASLYTNSMRQSQSDPSFLNQQGGGQQLGQFCYARQQQQPSCHDPQEQQLPPASLLSSSPSSYNSAPQVVSQQQQEAPLLNNETALIVDPALQARIEAIQIQQSLLGPNHPDVIFALSSLAKLHSRRGNVNESVAILEEVRRRSCMTNTTTATAAGNGNGCSNAASGGCIRNPQENGGGEMGIVGIPTEISFAHLS